MATGETHAVREVCEFAFKDIDIAWSWDGHGISEKGIDSDTGKLLVEIDQRYFRPTEGELLCGDYSKA